MDSVKNLHGIDEKRAAEQLGVSVHTLRMWRHRGRGPVYSKLGRRVLYLPPDLDAYLESCRIQPVNVA